MSYKQAIERGVELLTLCQQLQSEKDGVQRPAPDDFDKTKVLDPFAQDVMQSISYMTALHSLMPMKSQLADLGRELARQGKIAPDFGTDYARAALDHVTAEYALSTSADFRSSGSAAGGDALTIRMDGKGMDIDFHEGGKLRLEAPQKVWWSGSTAEVMDTALFAGQELIAITDDNGGFDLLYLGFRASGFATMAEAKAAAPEFAQQVLAKMNRMISGDLNG